jgi:hypothetical protein
MRCSPDPFRRRRPRGLPAAAVACGVAVVMIGAGPVARAAARVSAKPAFSFLRKYTDQLGVPGYEAGTGVTPQSDLYTGFAEFSLRAGTDQRGFASTGRTLERNRYPVLRARARQHGILYLLTAFAAPVAGTEVNFARIEAINTGRKAAATRVTGYIRHAGAALSRRPGGLVYRSYRFDRPATPDRPGLYFQPGSAFDARSSYEFVGHALLRDGSVLYDFPDPPKGVRLIRSLRVGRLPIDEGTIVGQTRYEATLKPGRRVALDFRMPVTPPAPASPPYQAVSAASFDAYRRTILATWRDLLGGAMRVSLPEAKVSDTFYASLVNILLARYRLSGNGDWVQAVNLQRYHAFYLRDAAELTVALDLAGLHRQAGENLPFFLTWQGPDGVFMSRPGQLDGFGQALWAFGQHTRLSGDMSFVRGAYPAVQRAMAWFIAHRATDPLHLMPPGDPRDNELVAGHLAGDNFWAVAGVTEAVEIARRLGQDADAARWASELGDFRRVLQANVRTAVARTGYIPPALDASGGQDWGNYWAVYPSHSFNPLDPAVTATVRHARSGFREGIATYGQPRVLHAYLGFRVLETQLVRGDQAAVVRGLYDALAHTTSTNASFETGPKPFGNRAIDTATVPHGWWAAEYVTLLRNMLVREDGHEVLVASALSPAWLLPGQTLSVADAPTRFGPVSFTLRAVHGGARLSWRAALSPEAGLWWPVPASARAVRARGLDGGRIPLPGASGSVTVSWRLSRAPKPSFEKTAATLLKAYRGRRRAS